jgi:hypothetical protein
MRVFKTKLFARFARKSSIDDADLCRAVDEIAAGSIDAQFRLSNLQAAHCSFRWRQVRRVSNDRFVSASIAGFLRFWLRKKDIANIDQEQLQHFRKLAEFLLAQSFQQLDEALVQGKLFEVEYAKTTI